MTSASRSKGEDVTAIASALTSEQRKVLRAGSGSRFKLGASILRHAKVQRWPSRPSYREFAHCWECGTPGKWGVVRLRRLSPLGLAVRAHLTDQEGQNR